MKNNKKNNKKLMVDNRNALLQRQDAVAMNRLTAPF